MQMKIGLIIASCLLLFKAFALPDSAWKAIANEIINLRDPESEGDKFAAINAYRNIKAYGIAKDVATKIEKVFNIAAKDLPKRYSELTAEEIKAETHSIVSKDKSKGGFKEFLDAQGVTCQIK